MSGDPLEGTSLAGFAGDLRAGKRSREAITSAYLDLIARLDGILGSYQHVAAESGLRSVRAVDNLLAVSTDLGPLMGMPVAVRSFSRLTACQPPSVHSLTSKNCSKRKGRSYGNYGKRGVSSSARPRRSSSPRSSYRSQELRRHRQAGLCYPHLSARPA
jgi:aspartyl-tRNA(Asn)/glutamyl-tRNA(Gln) amidotransferase subunit A